jgi:two-component system response regulator HydG
LEIRRRILVVDDEAGVLFVMEDALGRLGDEYEIVTARNGRDALHEINARPFDLVITDVRMPDITGNELTAAIKTLSPHTAVIWMTAYGCHKMRAAARRLNVYACLDKPVEISEIWRIVLEALESSQTPHSEPANKRFENPTNV